MQIQDWSESGHDLMFISLFSSNLGAFVFGLLACMTLHVFIPGSIMSNKKRLKYSHENMEKALQDIREKKISINQAAKLYNVPKTTVLDTLKEKYKNPGNIGGPTILTNSEEMLLVKWIIELGEVGFPITKTQLLESVCKLINNLGRKNPFKNGQPGKKWYNGFLARHPEVSKRVPQSLTICRAMVSESNIRNWFSKIHQYFVENDLIELLHDPKRIFNCDESGFYLSPQEKQVLVRKGSKKVYCERRERVFDGFTYSSC